ncbi:MAG TPA: hypothetical protein VFP65_21960 [Anaeromyxobacteraceae bacterium]|nr:hypothetical protein [Anaeromyxobacteraceae bacterium]
MAAARRWAILAVALCAPVAAAAAEPCTLPGGDGWTAHRTAHFDVFLGPRSRARIADLAAQLERTRALVVTGIAGEEVDIPGRIRVVAFDTAEDFRRTTGSPEATAFSIAGPVTGRATLALYVEGVEADAEVVARELAGWVSYDLYPRRRAWFAAGLATFVQTVALPQQDAPPPDAGARAAPGEVSGMAGLATPKLSRWVDVVPLVDAADLLAWRGQEDDGGKHGAWSWLLYHWLSDTRAKPFGDLSARLSRGEDPDAAWLAAFPDLDPARPDAMKRLSRDVDKYRRKGAYPAYRIRARAEVASSEVPLSRGDLHVAVLEARPAEPAAAATRAALKEALREEPGHAVATAWLARLDGTSAAPAMRERTRAAPGDGWAWLELGRALGAEAQAAERETALGKAAPLLPEEAPAHVELARAQVASGKLREALASANRGVELAPWSPGAVAVLAEVAARLGKCPEATTLRRRSLEAAAPAGPQDAATRRALGEVEERCAKPR